MRSCLPFFVWIWLLPLVSAQNRTETQTNFQIHIKKAQNALQLDGTLEEPDWQNAEKADHFWLKWPLDNQQAKTQTEIKLSYDAHFLYIAAMCYDSTPNYIVQNLKRDVGYWDSDGIAVVLDPANKATNGYFFGLTPAGAQTEGLISAYSDDDNFTWDNRWYGEVKHHVWGWSAEFAIPFQIIRFGDNAREWGINFIRNDASRGQYSTWTKIPLQFNGTDLGFTGKLIWDEAPSRAKGNYNVAPYVSGTASKDYEENTKREVKPGLGLDAKVGVGTAMNLDLTVNPDFSQIEIDEQVVNLTRFDIQLPEKRTFFLENADLFTSFGIPPIRPFFSRRIGLDPDGKKIPILGGARLTGNLNSNTRIGLMNMQTAARNDNAAQNFTAFSFNRRLFGRTALNGIFLNKQEFKGAEIQKGYYARNAGLEFTYTSTDGKWSYWATHHRSYKPGYKDKNWWGNSGVQYSARRFDLLVDVLHMGVNYFAEQGFEARKENYDVVQDTTIRIGYNFIFTNGNFRFFPKAGRFHWLNLSEFGFYNFTVINPNSSLNEESGGVNYNLYLKNTATFQISVDHSTSHVPVPFKFDDKDLNESPALPAGPYAYTTAGMKWSSDSRKPFQVEGNFNGGQFYNGMQWSAALGLRLRAQPWGNFSMKFQYNKLQFPTPFNSVELFNITPRVELFFNRNLNWTTFVQYNTQADNFNINSRLQWRYRPMSDLFVVFTDNYMVKQWGPRNRSFVIKWSYWL